MTLCGNIGINASVRKVTKMWTVEWWCKILNLSVLICLFS